jgi:D-amino-acid dehydrogenase
LKRKVVIIGGGVIGLNCAYYLSEAGHHVTVIDRHHPAGNLNCSTGNAGMIVPSHFVPLAAPGIIGQGIRWLLNPRSPFYIKPAFDLNMFYWLYKFWRSANKTHVTLSSPAIKSINTLGLSLYRELYESKKFDFFFREQGLLLICKTEKNLEEEVHTAKEATILGLETKVLDKEGLKQLEPDIRINATGGVWYPGDAHISPMAFIENLYAYLYKKENISFYSYAAVKEITKNNHAIVSVILEDDTELKGDEFILAAGSLSGELVKQLGIRLPLLGGKGYSLTVDQQMEKLKTPSILCEARVAVTPWDNRIRFGGTMELGGEEHTVNALRVEGIVNSIRDYFPEYDLAPFKNVTPWSGLRPCPPDGLPYIGRFKKTPNLIAATGHSMMGLSLAPATGHVVNSIVNGNPTAVDIGLFTPDRFD